MPAEHRSLNPPQVLKLRATLSDLSKTPNEESKNLTAKRLLRKVRRWVEVRGVAAQNRIYIVVDEAHRILREGVESIVEKFVRVSRKYDGGLILAT